jgi:nicotinamidase-related amidase
MMKPSDRDVLLIVDVQNDFCPGGALAVPQDDEIVPAVNRLGAEFAHVILTRTGTRADMLRLPARIPAGSRSMSSRRATASNDSGRQSRRYRCRDPDTGIARQFDFDRRHGRRCSDTIAGER